MNVITVTLIIIAMILIWIILRQSFKIGYYEAKLRNHNIDINHVKNMSFYKFYLNS